MRRGVVFAILGKSRTSCATGTPLLRRKEFEMDILIIFAIFTVGIAAKNFVVNRVQEKAAIEKALAARLSE
jgi:uncharacterized YccA/Bax inhibitor family protein